MMELRQLEPRDGRALARRAVLEALPADHVRDRSGTLIDLPVLAHCVEEQWAAIEMAGIAGEL